MDGAAAARALTRRVRRAGPASADTVRFDVSLARPEEDAEVRALLREAALPGSVRLSFEREPDSFAAGGIEGDSHAILVARERTTGRLAAIASRSSRVRFVNGRARRVGYLGGLRMAAASSRLRGVLDRGFALCREIDGRDPVAFYLASVVAGHASARRRLERGGPGWPRFVPLDELVTLAVPAGRSIRRRPRGIEVVSGVQAGLSCVVELLARHNRRFQVAPCWTAADLTSPVAGPPLERFVVAVRGGRVAGCAALWDQRAFRQVVVRGYTRWMARWRRPLNAAGWLIGAPYLPPVHSQLAFAHVSHLAVEDDDEDVAAALVGAARSAARAAGLDYVALGLSERHPLRRALGRAFRHRRYRSILYAGGWPDRHAAMDGLDTRPAHPEVAVL